MCVCVDAEWIVYECHPASIWWPAKVNAKELLIFFESVREPANEPSSANPPSIFFILFLLAYDQPSSFAIAEHTHTHTQNHTSSYAIVTSNCTYKHLPTMPPYPITTPLFYPPVATSCHRHATLYFSVSVCLSVCVCVCVWVSLYLLLVPSISILLSFVRSLFSLPSSALNCCLFNNSRQSLYNYKTPSLFLSILLIYSWQSSSLKVIYFLYTCVY